MPGGEQAGAGAAPAELERGPGGRGMEPVSGDGARFRGLNALRAATILAVVAFHVQFIAHVGIPGYGMKMLGWIPPLVDAFFVISGFLVYRPFARAMASGGSVDVKAYLRNRLLRILPLYYVVTVIAFALPYLTHHDNRGVLAFVNSLTFSGIYRPGNNTHTLTAAWTLDDEMVFYAFLPLLFTAVVALSAAASRLRAATWGVVLVALASIAYNLWITLHFGRAVYFGGNDELSRNVLAKAQPFAAGMLLANFHAARPRWRPGAAGILAMLGAALALGAAAEWTQLRQPWATDALMSAGFTVFVGAIVYSPPRGPLVAALGWAPLAFLGEISYGVYLWHGILIHQLSPLGVFSSRYAPALAEVYLAAVVIGTLTYFGIEKPALARKRGWAQRVAAASVPLPVAPGAGADEAQVLTPIRPV